MTRLHRWRLQLELADPVDRYEAAVHDCVPAAAHNTSAIWTRRIWSAGTPPSSWRSCRLIFSACGPFWKNSASLRREIPPGKWARR